MTTDTQRPIIAMPSDTSLMRTLAEACDDTLDDTDNDGANPQERSSVTLEPIAMPDGRVATVRCTRTKNRGLRVSVTFKAIRVAIKR